MGKIADFAKDLSIWLAQELDGFFRSYSARNPAQTIDRPETLVALHQAHISVYREGRMDPSTPGEQIPDRDIGAFVRDRLSKGEKVALIIGRELSLRRKLTDLHLPQSRLRDMAAIDLAANTPFSDTDMVSLVDRHRPALSGDISYTLVKPGQIRKIMHYLRDNKRSVADIYLELPSGFLRLNRAEKIQLDPHLAADRKRPLKLAAAFLPILCAAGTYAHAYAVFDKAQADIGRRVSGLQDRARIVRIALSDRNRQQQRLANLHKKKTEIPSSTAIWEELSRAIPDSAWITDIKIKRDQVQLTGFSRAAAPIIATLEGSPMFSDVAFSAPVVVVPKVDRERFAIRLKARSP